MHGVQEDDIRASQAADLWVLGLLAFETLAGQPLFHEDLSDQAIGAMLAGYVSLPRSQWSAAAVQLKRAPRMPSAQRGAKCAISAAACKHA